jgi:hypothetical protein
MPEEAMLPPLLQLVLGGLLLLAGSRFFWLALGVAGFVIGFTLTPAVLPSAPGWAVVLIGLAIGGLGALAAVVLPRLAAVVLGAAIGGWLAGLLLTAVIGTNAGWIGTVGLLIGALIGAVVASAVLDWALIVLTALAGASMVRMAVATLLDIPASFGTPLFIVLAIAGIVVQAGLLRLGRPGQG